MVYTNCRFCGARIAWLYIEGVRQAVNAEPHDTGDVVLANQSGTRGAVLVPGTPPAVARVPRYVRHLWTCARAKEILES